MADRGRSEAWLDPTESKTPAVDTFGLFLGLSTQTTGLSYYRLRSNQIARPVPAEVQAAGAREDQGGDAAVQSLITHHVALAGVSMVAPGISLGTTVRYIRGYAGLAAAEPGLATDELLRQADTLERRGKHEYDLDLGLLVGSPMLTVRLVARNMREPSFSGTQGGTIRLGRQVRAGFASRAIASTVVVVDLDLTRTPTVLGDRRNVAVGGEYWLGSWLGLRGGARWNLEQDERPAVGAFGLSIALAEGVYLDGQVTRGGDSTERGWAVAGRIGRLILDAADCPEPRRGRSWGPREPHSVRSRARASILLGTRPGRARRAPGGAAPGIGPRLDN